MRHKAKIILAAVVCALLAVGFALYPLIGNRLAQRNRSLVQTAYTESVAETEDERLRDMLAAAEGYNETLARGTAFTAEALAAAEQGYAELLALDDSGVMGYIEIPKIGVYLPIYHGTDAKTLDKGAGHRGWRGADYFRHLDELHVGDAVTVTNLWGELSYRVTELAVIQPDNIDAVKIQTSKDMLTLITCHPYASGGRYRLAVYCGRDEGWGFLLARRQSIKCGVCRS